MMFTKFTNTSQGLVESKPRTKPSGLNVSCLPCKFDVKDMKPVASVVLTFDGLKGRRKKKRCDLTKPICGRCRNSYGQDECVWSDVQKGQRSRPRRITSSQEPEHEPEPEASPISPSSSTSTPWSLSRPATTLSTDYPMDLGFENFCSWSIPDVVTNISPYGRDQLFVKEAFNNISQRPITPSILEHLCSFPKSDPLSRRRLRWLDCRA
jgi:hypothetical protein